MKKHLLALSLLAAVAVPASAEGVFIFGDVGRNKASVDVGSWELSKSSNGYSFGVGYAVNKTFSFEATYRDLGKFTFFDDEDEKDEVSLSAVEASAVAAYPISPVINVYGRLGVSRLTLDEDYQDFEYSYNNGSTSETKNMTFFGAGASYSLNDNVSLRAEYVRYSKWDSLELTTSRFTVGAVYSF